MFPGATASESVVWARALVPSRPRIMMKNFSVSWRIPPQDGHLKRITLQKNRTRMKKILSLVLVISAFVLLTGMVSGDRDCSRCDGTGKITDNCSFCGGRGWRDCSLCNGQKSLRCTVCGGAGSYACPHCHGRNDECRYCGGEGTIKCDRCSGTGSINCTSCGGAGNQPCSQCGQTGIKEWTCPDCRGTGKVDD